MARMANPVPPMYSSFCSRVIFLMMASTRLRMAAVSGCGAWAKEEEAIKMVENRIAENRETAAAALRGWLRCITRVAPNKCPKKISQDNRLIRHCENFFSQREKF